MNNIYKNKLLAMLVTTLAFCLPLTGNALAQEVEETSEWSLTDLFGEPTFDEIDIHGFLSQGFLYTTKNNFLSDKSKQGSFEFNELGINFTTDLTDRVFVGMQIYSRNLGDLGNNDIVIDWALLDYRFHDRLGFRLGKVKIPMGLYSETWDIDSLRNPIILPIGLYSENNRDAFISLNGIGIYGNFKLSDFGIADYDFVYGVSTLKADGGFARTIEGGSGELMDIEQMEVDFTLGAKVGWTPPLEGLRF